jgi:hypothetical protein
MEDYVVLNGSQVKFINPVSKENRNNCICLFFSFLKIFIDLNINILFYREGEALSERDSTDFITEEMLIQSAARNKEVTEYLAKVMRLCELYLRSVSKR